MLKYVVKYFDMLWSGCRSLACDESGSVTIGTGVYGVIFLLLIAGLCGFGSAFSKDVADDLAELKALLVGLT